MQDQYEELNVLICTSNIHLKNGIKIPFTIRQKDKILRFKRGCARQLH